MDKRENYHSYHPICVIWHNESCNCKINTMDGGNNDRQSCRNRDVY